MELYTDLLEPLDTGNISISGESFIVNLQVNRQLFGNVHSRPRIHAIQLNNKRIRLVVFSVSVEGQWDGLVFSNDL